MHAYIHTCAYVCRRIEEAGAQHCGALEGRGHGGPQVLTNNNNKHNSNNSDDHINAAAAAATTTTTTTFNNNDAHIMSYNNIT